jgi:TP901 family phage tail tape measure protein
MPAAGTTLNQALIARIGATHAGLRNELNSAVRTVRAAGRTMRTGFGVATRAAKVLAIGVAAVGIAALKMATDFETAMAEVSTLLDVGIPEMRELGEAVKALSIQFGGGLKDEARGLYQVFSAGANILRDNADAIQILTVANKAAVAGITDVGVAVEAIMRVMNAYGKTAADATDISDTLFQIVRKGVTTFGELAPTIGQVAGTAAAAGVSFEEMAAVIATATTRLPIEQVITGANQLLLAFISRTEDTEKAAKALGVRFDATALAGKGVHGVLTDIFDAMGVGVQELAKIASGGEDVGVVFETLAARTGLTTEVISALFPNVRALRVALAVMSNGGRDFTAMLEQMNARAGATEEAYQKMAATFGFLFKVVKQEVLVAFVDLGDTLFPIAKEVAGAIGTIARNTREWIRANQELIGQNVTKVFEGVIRGVGKAAEGIVEIVEFFRRNPIAGEFGLVGLVFLGPSGAATFGLLGLGIDKLSQKLFGPTEVAERLAQNILDATREMDEIREAMKGLGPSAGVPLELANMSAKELADRMQVLQGIVDMNTISLMRTGDEAKTAFDTIMDGITRVSRGMQEFSFGDLFAGFAGGELADTTKEIADNTSDMVDSVREWLGLTGQMIPELEMVVDTSILWKNQMIEIIKLTGTILATGLANIITDFGNAAAAAKNLGKTILREVVGALLKAVIFARIIRPLLTSMGLPPVLPFKSGGVVRQARSGMLLPDAAPAGFGGGIPIMAHPGEAVLTKAAVRALGGGGGINAINRGDAGPMGGGALNVQMVMPETSDIPEPLDFGILATKPQVLKYFSEVMRQVEFLRGE